MKKVNYMRIALSGKAYTADSLCTTDRIYAKAEECLKEVQKGCTTECYLDMHDVLTEAGRALWESDCPKKGVYMIRMPHTDKGYPRGYKHTKACTVACLHVRDRKVAFISFGRGPAGATSIHTDSQQTAAEAIAQKVMGKPLDKCPSTSRAAIESLALALLGQVPMSREG